MALDNLSVEVQKHAQLAQEQKSRFFKLLKVVNKIRQEGAIRFAFAGGDVSEIAGRIRVLFALFVCIHARSTSYNNIGTA